MSDHANMKLGKNPARHDPRTLRAAKYLLAPSGALPAPLPAVDWLAAVPCFPMYANDVYGDCAIAAIGHMVQVWAANAGARPSTSEAGQAPQGPGACHLAPLQTPSEDEILRVYQILSPNDDGCVLIDVLNYWRQNPICGIQLGAYARVDPRNANEVKVCLEVFGGLYAGARLPLTAQTQDVWNVMRPGDSANEDALAGSAGGGRTQFGPTSGAASAPLGPDAPGSWGGHCIPFGKYDAQTARCVTWGAVKDATWPWMLEYVDELYALVSPDWLDGTGKTPDGLDLAALENDLKLVTA